MTSVNQHAALLNDVHPELRKMINNFLQSKNIPLHLHSISFTAVAPAVFHCCMIDGMIHCGPECP
jgi:hypothetical protein